MITIREIINIGLFLFLLTPPNINFQSSKNNVLITNISIISEKKFLEFFFKRLKKNDSGHYAGAFPYISPCGHEKNFVRCDDLPVVFTQVIHRQGETEQDLFSYCNGGDLLTVQFQPDQICMLPESGRVYHPAPLKFGGVGLVKSQIAIEFSKDFEFGKEGETSPPVHFSWKGVQYNLKNELIELIRKEDERKLRLEKQFGSYDI